ncbi:anti-sigma factor [Streptomyces avermitilis]|uniref:anti-sigma factor n=1 Tax=Streptomyces avermitilis TaxID=33903 RepID=UPI0033C823A9
MRTTSLLCWPHRTPRPAQPTKFAGQGTGTVVVSENRDQAVLIASGLTTSPKGKVYPLWFDDDGTMRSAGLMNADREAAAVLMTGRGGPGNRDGRHGRAGRWLGRADVLTRSAHVAPGLRAVRAGSTRCDKHGYGCLGTVTAAALWRRLRT